MIRTVLSCCTGLRMSSTVSDQNNLMLTLGYVQASCSYYCKICIVIRSRPSTAILLYENQLNYCLVFAPTVPTALKMVELQKQLSDIPSSAIYLNSIIINLTVPFCLAVGCLLYYLLFYWFAITVLRSHLLNP